VTGGDDSARGFVHTAHGFLLVHPVWPVSCPKHPSPAKLITVSIRVTKMVIRLDRNEDRMVEEI
jgi:hypothetical protein